MKTLIILAAVLLGGCAALPEGVTMSEEDRASCKAEGCTVWTETELRGMAEHFFRQGYGAGRKSL